MRKPIFDEILSLYQVEPPQMPPPIRRRRHLLATANASAHKAAAAFASLCFRRSGRYRAQSRKRSPGAVTARPPHTGLGLASHCVAALRSRHTPAVWRARPLRRRYCGGGGFRPLTPGGRGLGSSMRAPSLRCRRPPAWSLHWRALPAPAWGPLGFPLAPGARGAAFGLLRFASAAFALRLCRFAPPASPHPARGSPADPPGLRPGAAPPLLLAPGRRSPFGLACAPFGRFWRHVPPRRFSLALP